MKIILTFLIIIIAHVGTAQKVQTAVVGFPSVSDIELTSYDKNPSAKAVVLYHKGFIHYQFENDVLFMFKKVHKKIKVFNTTDFTDDIVEIPLYNQEKESEELVSFTAFTHNGYEKSEIVEDNVFTETSNENKTLKKFVFPNIKNGSILEYYFVIKSPFIFSLDKWYFQNTLPTIYSEFKTEIFTNFRFRTKIVGNEYIDFSETKKKKSCFTVPYGGTKGDCLVLINTMVDTPPFVEQKYMLSMNNYILKIDYELEGYTDFNGYKRNFVKTWNSFDNTVKKEDWYEKELENYSFFKRKIPNEIYSEGTELEKANALYYYFKEHYTWNGYIGLNPSDIKKAFKDKIGSQSQINLSLYNGLKIADLNPSLVFSSSNNNAVPDENEPLFTKLDYLLLRLEIDNKEYFLDASRKDLPFGMPHPDALNVKGRVIHFNDEDNYWLPITPITNNYHAIRSKISATDEAVFSGTIDETYTGYLGYYEKKKLIENGEEAYIKEKNNINTSVADFTIENVQKEDQPLKLNYNIEVETESVGDKILVNAFYFERLFENNPFEIENRIYNVDFGYPISATYLVSIDLNERYTIDKLPENKFFELAEKSGSLTVVYSKSENQINIRYSLVISKVSFSPKEYYNLRKLFEEVKTIKQNALIVLKEK